jgi:hypothetical protein
MSTNRAKRTLGALGARNGSARISLASSSNGDNEKRVKNKKPMTEIQKMEFHLLFNSIPITMGSATKRVQPVEKTLQQIFHMVRYTNPSGNRGIVNPDAVQQVNIATLFMNPYANRDSLIFYVASDNQRYLMDGLQTMSTIVRVLNGNLPVPIDEQLFANAYRDISDGDILGFSKDFLYVVNIDDDAMMLYDLESDEDSGRWKPPTKEAPKKRYLSNIALWRKLYIDAIDDPNLAVKRHVQNADSKYVCEEIESKIFEEITVPVLDLKEENGWTLESASLYVADIMGNREPLCPHEICMILQTPGMKMVKQLSEDPIVKESVHRIYDNVRSAHFALTLTICLLYKRHLGTPGVEVSPHFLKSVALELVLVEKDIESIKKGFKLFQKLPKFPRGSKERIALAVAFMSLHPSVLQKSIVDIFTTKQSIMRATEDGKLFIDSMKDSLINSLLAMERIIYPELFPDNSPSNIKFVPHESDFQVIDLTDD